MIVAVGLYFGLRNVAGSGEIGWVCVLAAFPFALCGFFTYNGMTFERFLLAVIRSELLYPRKLVFRAENFYALAMEHSTVKEAYQTSFEFADGNSIYAPIDAGNELIDAFYRLAGVRIYQR